VAALLVLVEKNQQMPPWCTSGGFRVEKNLQMPPCCICVQMAALLVEKYPQMPPCCVLAAALLVEKNPQMLPSCTSGGNTGRK
jgi:hypothetical protein